MKTGSIIAFLLLLLSAVINLQAQTKPLVGTIRWDGWTGPTINDGAQLDTVLSPTKYHYRVPFYTDIIDSNTLIIDACTQAVMDSEIFYAAHAGIDYWAFDWYQSGTGFEVARKLYQASTYNQYLNYCLVLEDYNIFYNMTPPDTLVNEFKKINYQKVAGGRPLMYMLGYSGLTKPALDSIRVHAIAAGVGNPYMVYMRTDTALRVLDSLGFDAISEYAVNWLGNGVSYDSLAAADTLQWRDLGIYDNLPEVPCVTTGWDNRPFHDHPATFYNNPGPNSWVQQATASQIARHIAYARDWVAANPAAVPSNTVIVYAWNEFAEGGWLCPGLPGYGGTGRVDSLHAVLGGYDIPTSVQDLKPEDNTKIFPNPSATGWQLAVGYDAIGSAVEVYNAAGQMVFQSEIKNQLSEVRLPAAASGIYELRIISQQGIVVKKLVKM